ncbi:hypothetical protein BDF20DRAFT_825710 [Mycotypha africana]|uniref:uncharacterized protein n=1 Tax=Mycotypha africana TaxID=64632 RepID=UPI002301A8C1|nr:uncharacterized protein BDF20DRAFT_825710 [Mycotypha africana]KAI8970202.1 hypothetical protein BDF20DRAFT_825710 [Mycotypha africana]
MDNIDDLILSLTDKQIEEQKKAAEDKKQAERKSGKRSRKDASDSDDEDAVFSEEEEIDEDLDDINVYGPDLYKDEEDRRRLQALPEVERERILAERSEERQRHLERLEVRKLLKDGRREDVTRRSTRSKASGTANALTELARRREEKHKSRKQRRVKSPSPERKSRSNYDSDVDYSPGEESEEEVEKKARKRTPTLDEITAIQFKRKDIEKWLFAPHFDNTIIGCFVRLLIGADSRKESVYRLCEVLDVVPWHKTYKIGENTWCNRALKLKHGKAEKDFPMDILSNSPVTEHEYQRFLATLEYDGVRPPTIEQVEQKQEDIKQAERYVLNDKEVNEMIEKKRAVKGASVNAVMERANLLARMEHFKANNDTEGFLRVQKELKELDERIGLAPDNIQGDVWANINKQNRQRDRTEAHEVERREAEQRRKNMIESARAAKQQRQQMLQVKANEPSAASDSSLLSVGTNKKPALAMPKVSKAALLLGQTKNNQTEYERLVTRISKQMNFCIRLD